MRKLLFAVALSVAVLALTGTAFAVDRHNIIVPEDDKAFSVEQSSIVRLTGKGIAGSTIEAEVVSGPAKIDSVNEVFPRKDGKPVLGTVKKEFNLKSSGRGTVKVKITVTGPQKGATPKVTTYEYEVVK
jgi:hypothetical protein